AGAEPRLPAGSHPVPCNRSGEDVFDDAGFPAVGDLLFLAVVQVSQLLVVETELVQQRRLKIVGSDDVGDRLVAELIGLAIGHAPLDSAAGQPDAEALAVVIASDVGPVTVVFGHRESADLAAPVDD